MPGVSLRKIGNIEGVLAVNEDGSARFFDESPVKAGGTWIPHTLTDSNYCNVAEEYENEPGTYDRG